MARRNRQVARTSVRRGPDGGVEHVTRHGPGLIEQATGVHMPPAALPLFTSTVPVAAYTWAMHRVAVSSVGTGNLLAVLHTLLCVGLTSLTWRHAGPRNKELRWAATVTVGWHLALITVLAAIGPWHWPWSMVWLAGSIGVGGYWIIRQWFRSLGRQHDEQAGGGAAGEIRELTGLARAKVAATVDERGTVTGTLALPPGEIAANEFGGDTSRAVASLLDLPEPAVRITPRPDAPRMANLVIEPHDYLADPAPWPGGSAVGASIAEPLRAGRYSDGSPAMVDLVGVRSGTGVTAHLQISGMSGSGKSDGNVGLVADGLTRTEANFLTLDPVKGAQTWGFLAPHLWFETEMARCRAIMRRLPYVIQARTNHLASRNLKGWEPGCGLNFLYLTIEEAYKLLRDGRYNEVGLAARSAGISIITNTQRPTHDNVDTTWRSIHSAFWCFGVQSSDEADFGLDEQLQGIAHPEAWGTSRPGYSYLSGGGIEPLNGGQRPLRSYRTDNLRGDPNDRLRDQLAEYISRWRRHLGLTGDLDPVTAEAFGELWTDRPLAADPYAAAAAVPVTMPHPTTPPPARPAAPVAAAVHLTKDDMDDDEDQFEVAEEATDIDAEQGEALAEALTGELARLSPTDRAAVGPVGLADPRLADDTDSDTDEAAEAAADRELAALDPAGEGRLTYREVRTAWLAWLAERYAAGQTTLLRAEAVAWAQRHGRSDSWVDTQFAALLDGDDARRHPVQRGVLVLDRAPVDPLADLAGGLADLVGAAG